MSASGNVSLRVRDNGSGGDDIVSRGHDKGDSRYASGDGGDGGVRATSSSSKGSVSLDNEARYSMAGAEMVGAGISSSSSLEGSSLGSSS
nr:hypothetical protein [Tanacetum cinerariifolium]